MGGDSSDEPSVDQSYQQTSLEGNQFSNSLPCFFRYQREIHSKKIDFIGKLAELFLGDAAKKMEVKQIIE